MHRLRRIKRVPLLVWYSRHELTHVLIGLMFAWFLREFWGTFSLKYIILAGVSSVLIDVDHLVYYFTYGRNEPYARDVRAFLKSGQIGTFIRYCTSNHKHNTSLLTHNVFVLGFFVLLSFVSFYFDWNARVIVFGSIVLHLIVDMIDDLWTLGYVNENWKRLRRKKSLQPPITVQSPANPR